MNTNPYSYYMAVAASSPYVEILRFDRFVSGRIFLVKSLKVGNWRDWSQRIPMFRAKALSSEKEKCPEIGMATTSRPGFIQKGVM